MELKIFRDTMPQAGTVCTVKAELPLETEILVSYTHLRAHETPEHLVCRLLLEKKKKKKKHSVH